ncbi:MAG TPA: DNA (cytosine-5-)-methyltransferase [Egibacteraceae bacterium]|nr:DNA (cytosine-5-)-methyltransferase [Egibacteraceae bacterium]
MHPKSDTGRLSVAGLFAGIGGIELGFHAAGLEAEMLCEVWEPAQAVLQHRFPDTPLHGDVRGLRALPTVDIVTAGFPCTDLSQAGRTAGITGKQSGLVGEVFRLLERSKARWLVLENVRNMLPLDRGRAMTYLVGELEQLGYRWAYRVVDSRFSGVPQRRHRVLLVASRQEDPRGVLFADDEAEPPADAFRQDVFGFYWTEGLRGLGWAQDATPPLKGGSTIGIPSPPAIWVPGAEPGRKLVVPSVQDAEALQGFPREWTAAAAAEQRAKGIRWKLAGNAVTVPVATWLGNALREPGSHDAADDRRLASGDRWPNAAWGSDGTAWVSDRSFWPRHEPYRHLTDVVDVSRAEALSHKGAAGFLDRANRGQLRFVEDFLLDVKEHVEVTRR